MKTHETRRSLKDRIWLWECGEEDYLHLPVIEVVGVTETKNDGKRIREFVVKRKKKAGNGIYNKDTNWNRSPNIDHESLQTWPVYVLHSHTIWLEKIMIPRNKLIRLQCGCKQIKQPWWNLRQEIFFHWKIMHHVPVIDKKKKVKIRMGHQKMGKLSEMIGLNKVIIFWASLKYWNQNY